MLRIWNTAESVLSRADGALKSAGHFQKLMFNLNLYKWRLISVCIYTLKFNVMGLFSKNNKEEDKHEDHSKNAAAGEARYQCPMKCEGEKTYDQPGRCPVCKMYLQPVK
jgi:hypothetical protein